MKGSTCKKCGAYIGAGLFQRCGRCEDDILKEVNAAIKKIQKQREQGAIRQ